MPKTPAGADAATEQTLSTLRSQVARLRRERDDHARELDTLRERNRALQKSLDETVDRLLELERRRARERAGVAGERASPLDPAVAREQARDDRDLHARASGPLRSIDPDTPADEDPGFEKPLSEIEGIPKDVAERLVLVGVHTNLDLLHKAGPARHRRSLATSMRMEGHTLVQIVHRADLARIGLRSRDLQMLTTAGIDDLRGLAGASSLDLLARIRAHDGGTIDAATVDRWIERARGLTWMVDE